MSDDDRQLATGGRATPARRHATALVLGWICMIATVAQPSGLAADALAKPEVGDDPRWLDQLPLVVIPLPKPDEIARHPPRHLPHQTVEAAAVEQRVTEPKEPEETDPPDAGVSPPAGEDLATVPRDDRETDHAMDHLADHEATEDAAMIEVLETTVIARPDAVEVPAVSATHERPEILPETLDAAMEDIAATFLPGETRTEAIAATPSRPNYRWHVQLLAGRSLPRVQEDRRLFVLRYGDLLEGLVLTISQSRYGDARDEFYRLRALEWDTPEPARAWCAELQGRGHQCLVTRITLSH